MIRALDHIQLAIPEGAENTTRPFYDLIGLSEVPKPKPLSDRGGFWMAAGLVEVHFGVDPKFTPATKAHPAFVVDNLDELAERLAAAGHQVGWDDTLPNVRRFFTNDPVGNRIELIAG